MSGHAPRAIAIFAAVVAVVVGGCGDDAPDDRPSTTADHRPAPESDRRLVRPGTPGAMIARHWEYLAAGAVPVALLDYHDAIRSAIPVADLTAAIADLQYLTDDADLVVTEIEPTPLGRLVLARVVHPDRPSASHAFLVRQTNGRWQILYDTTLVGSLSTYLRQKLSGGAEPTPQQTRAVMRTVARLRAAAVSEPPDATTTEIAPPQPAAPLP